MIPILYEKSETDFTHNGEGLLTDAISCDITEERNGIYELTMTYPISGKMFSEIAEGKIIGAKPNETSSVQPFRIYAISKPINGITTVKAEHISYDANGIPVLAMSGTGISAQEAISRAISAGAFQQGFTAWSDISTVNSINISAPRSLRAVLGGSQGSVLDVWGGEYEYDVKCIKLHAHRGNDNGVVIEYGKNLTDAKQERNITDTYTHIAPYAKYTEDQNGESVEIIVTLTEKVIAFPTAENIGHQKAYIVDLSDKFAEGEEVTEAALRAKAIAYRDAHSSLAIPKVSITVSFVQLWQTEEYKDIAPLERVSLCDSVTIRFTKLGINATAKVIKTIYDCLGEKYKSIDLGEARSNFAETVLKQNQAISELASALTGGLSKVSAEFEQAILNATNAITGNSGGYVVLHPAEHPQEILILDQPTIAAALDVWRWNSAGLGHSSSGYNGSYELAMTADGKINAAMILTGILSAIKLQSLNYNPSTNVGSMIDLDSGTFSLGGGKLKYENSTLSMIDAIISGVFRATNAAENFYTEISEGEISIYVNNVKAGFITAAALGQANASLGIYGAEDALSISMGYKDTNGVLQDFYYLSCSSNAYYRHSFYGVVHFSNTAFFEDDVSINTLLNVGIGIVTPSISNTLGGAMLYQDSNGSTWLGTTSKATYIRGAGLEIGDANNRTHIFGSYIFVRNAIHFEGDIYFYNRSTNVQYKTMWYDSYNTAINVGNDSLRLYLKGSTIYANNSPIATSSDERVKEEIESLDDRYLQLMKQLTPKRFKYRDGSSGRKHTGFTAQDLVSAMDSVGIGSKELAAFVDMDDGKEYAIRYEELISPMLLYIQHLEKRIEALEGGKQ